MKRNSIGPLELLLIQPTTFCNLDCTYCYLPNRTLKKRLDPTALESVLNNVFSSKIITDNLLIQFHSGEPLAVPCNLFRKYCEVIDRYGDYSNLTLSVQTNGTTINEEWCRLFKDYNIQIGISLDGGKDVNDSVRVDRKGSGTYEKVLKGIRLLKEFNIHFSILSVISIESILKPQSVIDDLTSLGAESYAFNVEESDGINSSDLFVYESYRTKVKDFYDRLIWTANNDKAKIREVRNMLGAILGKRNDNKGINVNRPFSIVSVDTDGNMSTFSPELLSESNRNYNFIFGNLIYESLDDIIKNGLYLPIQYEIQSGIDLCSISCDYFELCGGGIPSNKFGEHKRFDVTETEYCKTAVQDMATSMFEFIEKENDK